MANSSGLNERPSRTSLRGVATLYQGSMPILLRSLTTSVQREASRRGDAFLRSPADRGPIAHSQGGRTPGGNAPHRREALLAHLCAPAFAAAWPYGRGRVSLWNL